VYTLNSISPFLICLHGVFWPALANLIRITELEHHWPRGRIWSRSRNYSGDRLPVHIRLSYPPTSFCV
jgi:hypothetical protein